MKRYQINFSGRVQGVGFRFTSKQVARSFEVVGTVQNLPTGSVRMVLEGARLEIDRFIESVCESTHGSVSNIEIQESPSSNCSDGAATRPLIGFEIID
ncbi:MAG: acylphosphatase [Mariniblastus sp.]|jgi:acylphosphatase